MESTLLCTVFGVGITLNESKTTTAIITYYSRLTMRMDPRDRDEGDGRVEFQSAWGDVDVSKAVAFAAVLVTLTLTPLFFVDNERVQAFKEAFVLLGG